MREVSTVTNKLRAVSAVIPLVAAVAWVPTASAHAAVGQAPLSASEATALAQDVTQKVIVLLKPAANVTPEMLPLAGSSDRPAGSRLADEGEIDASIETQLARAREVVAAV